MSTSPQLQLPEPPLTDGSIILREWQDSDVEAVVAASHDSSIADETTSIPKACNDVAALDWISRQRTRLIDGVGYPFALVDIDTGEVSGFIGLWLRAANRTTLGYWVLPKARGKRLATRAVRLVTEWAFVKLGISTIEIAVEPDNVPSIRVAEGVGFKFTNSMSDYQDVGGRSYGVVLVYKKCKASNYDGNQ